MTVSNIGKYNTRNPVARWVISRFLARISAAIDGLDPAGILDLGCGEGVVAQRLAQKPGRRYTGLDTSREALDLARRRNPGLQFIEADFFTAPLPGGPDTVIVCLEVLEHLDDPDALLARIAACPRKAALLSVPWEPWFRIGNVCRGKHLLRLGNHPEHVQHWNPASFDALLAKRFPTREVTTSFPWIIATVR